MSPSRRGRGWRRPWSGGRHPAADQNSGGHGPAADEDAVAEAAVLPRTRMTEVVVPPGTRMWWRRPSSRCRGGRGGKGRRPAADEHAVADTAVLQQTMMAEDAVPPRTRTRWTRWRRPLSCRGRGWRRPPSRRGRQGGTVGHGCAGGRGRPAHMHMITIMTNNTSNSRSNNNTSVAELRPSRSLVRGSNLMGPSWLALFNDNGPNCHASSTVASCRIEARLRQFKMRPQSSWVAGDTESRPQAAIMTGVTVTVTSTLSCACTPAGPFLQHIYVRPSRLVRRRDYRRPGDHLRQAGLVVRLGLRRDHRRSPGTGLRRDHVCLVPALSSVAKWSDRPG